MNYFQYQPKDGAENAVENSFGDPIILRFERPILVGIIAV